jgi:hypothetical protein
MESRAVENRSSFLLVFFKKNPEELEFEFRRYLNMATGKFLQKSNESDMYKSSWISFSKD